ncbi:unnamed protein product [Linum tenue]|uniref:Uncharacterized protein n=1 Tax=Linum tenue TaxID=586396 RepID=A0AAV0LZA1_9ROSI|nr:unnamed protein product [Linum tenue]
MAKNRNKKKKAGADSMDTTEPTVSDSAQAMDTSEPGASRPAAGGLNRIQKGRPMKRSKNVRKKKALEKAISKTEQSFEKVAKSENKKQRTQSAKQLYD